MKTQTGKITKNILSLVSFPLLLASCGISSDAREPSGAAALTPIEQNNDQKQLVKLERELKALETAKEKAKASTGKPSLESYPGEISEAIEARQKSLKRQIKLLKD